MNRPRCPVALLPLLCTVGTAPCRPSTMMREGTRFISSSFNKSPSHSILDAQRAAMRSRANGLVACLHGGVVVCHHARNQPGVALAFVGTLMMTDNPRCTSLAPSARSALHCLDYALTPDAGLFAQHVHTDPASISRRDSGGPRTRASPYAFDVRGCVGRPTCRCLRPLSCIPAPAFLLASCMYPALHLLLQLVLQAVFVRP